jgi:hypothetical protein
MILGPNTCIGSDFSILNEFVAVPHPVPDSCSRIRPDPIPGMRIRLEFFVPWVLSSTHFDLVLWSFESSMR